MTNINQLFIIIFFIKTITFALDYSNICQQIKNECIGKYDNFKYNEKCTKLNCIYNTNFKYTCNGYCTKNKSICDSFLDHIQQFQYAYQSNTRLKQIIQKCNYSLIKLDLKQVCLTGKQCYRNMTLERDIYSKKLVKLVICPCNKGTLNYVCNHDYCTKNNLVCEELLKQKYKIITNCNNNKQFII